MDQADVFQDKYSCDSQKEFRRYGKPVMGLKYFFLVVFVLWEQIVEPHKIYEFEFPLVQFLH